MCDRNVFVPHSQNVIQSFSFHSGRLVESLTRVEVCLLVRVTR